MRTVRLDEDEEQEQTETAAPKPRRRRRSTKAKKVDFSTLAKDVTDNTYIPVANLLRLITAWTTDSRNIIEELPAQAIAYGSLNFGLRKTLPRFLPDTATNADEQDVKDLTSIAVGLGAYIAATIGNAINNVGTPKKAKRKATVKEERQYPTDEEYYEDPYIHEDLFDQQIPPDPVGATVSSNHASTKDNDGIPDGWEDAYESPRG